MIPIAKTKRQEKRDQRARDRAMREKHRLERETFLHQKAAARPDRPGPRGERWMPIPETEYECNQFGNVRKRVQP